jgi:methylamine dehydrogenase accessory protein MauD
MTEALLVSNVILWVLVVVLALIVLALARQVGILHERVAPAGALMPTSGPKVGEMTKALNLTDLGGNEVIIGGANPQGEATFVLFISPTCPVCKSLVPTAKSLARREGKRMRLVFASDGDKIEQHQAYARDLDLGNYHYVISEGLGMAYEVSKLPFALLLGGDGTLHSKGLVNTREHLESLVEAMDSGVATLQDYMGSLESEHENPVKEPTHETT